MSSYLNESYREKYPNIICAHLHLLLSVRFDGFIGDLLTWSSIKISRIVVSSLCICEREEICIDGYMQKRWFGTKENLIWLPTQANNAFLLIISIIFSQSVIFAYSDIKMLLKQKTKLWNPMDVLCNIHHGTSTSYVYETDLLCRNSTH